MFKFWSLSIPTYEEYNKISLISETHGLYYKYAARCLCLLISQTRLSAPDASPTALPDYPVMITFQLVPTLKLERRLQNKPKTKGKCSPYTGY